MVSHAGEAFPLGSDWWQASDSMWYPPELHPAARSLPPPTRPSTPPPFPADVTARPPSHLSIPTPARPVSVTTVVNTGPTGFTAPSAAARTSSTVGNVLWLVFAGIWLAIAYVVAGLLNVVTIIGIPFGIQSFKLAGYALWPFGRVVVQRPGRDVGLSTLGNVVWFIFGGFWLAMLHLAVGLLCVTIIGAPLGLASIKMAGLAIAPFGKVVMSRSELARSSQVVVVSSIT